MHDGLNSDISVQIHAIFIKKACQTTCIANLSLALYLSIYLFPRYPSLKMENSSNFNLLQ